MKNTFINPIRPKVRLFGDNQCNSFIQKMNNFNWDAIYADNVDWYHEFISVIFLAQVKQCILSKIKNNYHTIGYIST